MLSLSLFRAGQVLLRKTHEAWEGGVEAQLTLPLPSSPFPRAPSISTSPLPSLPFPFLSPSPGWILPPSSTKPQSAKPNVFPGAGNHLHHRLHQSASEVWRAHCAGVRNELQMLIITSRPYICECNLIFFFFFNHNDNQIRTSLNVWTWKNDNWCFCDNKTINNF